MKVKAFKIRLQEEHLPDDQENINRFLSYVNIKKTSVKLVADHYWSVLAFYDDSSLAASSAQTKVASVSRQAVDTAQPEVLAPKADKIFFPPETELSEQEKRIYEALKHWRADKALTSGLPSYLVCSNSELLSIAKVKPKSVTELANIKGFGAQKISKYGEDIVALLNSVF